MSNLASKDCQTFPTSLSQHISPVNVPVKGLSEHFQTRLSAIRALCFPLCWAWNPLSLYCALVAHDVKKWVPFESLLRGFRIFQKFQCDLKIHGMRWDWLGEDFSSRGFMGVRGGQVQILNFPKPKNALCPWFCKILSNGNLPMSQQSLPQNMTN